jgi:hypothetical protein
MAKLAKQEIIVALDDLPEESVAAVAEFVFCIARCDP